MEEKMYHGGATESQKLSEQYDIIANKNNEGQLTLCNLTLKNPSQNIKNLLSDRFKQKRDRLFQSSSIYVDSGEIKNKKRLISERINLVSQIKQTSLQKLPNLQKSKRTSPPVRLSQTINHDQSLNNSRNENLNYKQKSFNTIDVQSYEGVNQIKNDFSAIRTSLDSIRLPTNKFNSAQKLFEGIEKNQKNSQNLASYQLEKELKKKYLKSIVDRYFPDPSQEQKIEKHPIKKTPLNMFRQKAKLQNPSVQLPSLNISMDGKKQQNNEKIVKNEEKIEKQNQHETNIQKQQKYFQTDNSLLKSHSSALSLTQSYILEQISENEEFEQHQNEIENFYENAAFYDQTGLFSSKSQSSAMLNGSMQDLYDSSNTSQTKDDEKKFKQKKQKVYENHSFVIYKVRTYAYQNLSQSNDLKVVSFQTEFRKYFKTEGALQLKRREFKAQQMMETTKKKATLFLWQEDLFDSTCIKINLSKASTFLSQSPLSLGKLLYKISPYQSGSNSHFALIQPINSSKYQFSSFNQHKLLSNFQYGLLKFIKNISQQLQPLSLSLINNKLSLNNMFMIEDDQYVINQWGYSFFKHEYLIQTKKFQKRVEPILKNQAGEWFVTPEYLAPQILQNLCYSKEQVIKYWKKIEGKKMEKTIINQNDLFAYGNKCDVWSLGLTVLQIITLIPMWIGQKCIVQNKTSPKISPRKGFLHCQHRDLLKILTKQSYLRQNLNKILRVQSEPYTLEPWIKHLIFRMVDLDPMTRISFQQMVTLLNEEQSRIKQKLKHSKK